MSDDWSFHDAVEDGIRDSAGHLALAGVLASHSQRRRQLQALEAARKQQAEIAKTEQERLAVEKQRLELEILKQQAEKEEKEAVRLLRVLMAEMAPEFETLGSRGVLPAAPAGIRQDYRMAVLLTELAVVRSRSSVLSELSDLKELSRLENQAQDLVAQHFAGRNPLEITRAKWKELEAWMAAFHELEKVVNGQLAAVPPDDSTKIAGLCELQNTHDQLAVMRDDLSERLREFTKAIPADAMDAAELFPELAEQAQYDDLREGRSSMRLDTFAACWGKVADGSVPHGLITESDAALARLRELFEKHALHRAMLASAAESMQRGDLADAERDVAALGEMQFADLSYASVMEIVGVKASLANLQVARRGDAIRQAEEILRWFPKSTPRSQLRQTAMLHMERGGREKRNVLVVMVAGVVLAVSLAVSWGAGQFYHQKEQQRLVAEAEKMVAEAIERLPQQISEESVGSTLVVPIALQTVVKFSYIPSGAFTMGSPESESGRSSDEDQVQVTLTKTFWLAQHEITQGQWNAVMGSNPSQFQGSDQLPVESVSWEEAQAFIAKLNSINILPEGWHFTLPTEAQWEYACRAGATGPYHGSSLDDIGWYDGNSGGESHEVGRKKANSWGLYDMHGNVWEWCLDAWDGSTKSLGGTDPVGGIGFGRIYRGGSWNGAENYCRSAYRSTFVSDGRRGNLGFRPAVVPVTR
ncbi:MAG: SUMF1/EgtB/PvdO family nonheme iron enzyme [Prosthecobacter sp.]|uniref:SUMF1/EgtB/PvdO family nonheme iron enzyme n=1 Tax=Prosthecobacter sp. TaxID=1965333 RepID=UPI0026397DE3|nr:SUMF1/EgtB/PvdO family nonheme iron enzyme [Prosthecobacter sp.]MCF7788514.1 SUMF1/EgtB/PvdO family nonheme iron enzyme [Prosthecobacter sp.]